jgi:hypothetical protein
MLQFHPLAEGTTLYVEAPISIEEEEERSFRFTVLAPSGSFPAKISGATGKPPVVIQQGLGGESSVSLSFDQDDAGIIREGSGYRETKAGWYCFTVRGRGTYAVKLSGGAKL